MATTQIDTDRLLLHIMGLRRDRQQSGSLSGGGLLWGHRVNAARGVSAEGQGFLLGQVTITRLTGKKL